MNLLVNVDRRAVASVGVLGAGIFGVTAALELAYLGLQVVLYEKREDILDGTTSRNFFRVHRGYHYPRDLATAQGARDGYVSFSQVFSEAFATPVRHYYAIAASGSHTSVEEFEQHCQALDLHARRVRLPDLVPGSVAACYEVDEAYYDATSLRKLAWERLQSAEVQVAVRSTRAALEIAQAHDFLVVAAYGSLNEVLAALDCPPVELQYELCEVPVVYAPNLDQASLVVLDGPFVSVGPYGNGCHILYDVVNSVHTRSIRRVFSRYYDRALDSRGLTKPSPGLTRFDQIFSSTRRFLATAAGMVHVGSLFAERVILPGVDKTDARPTVVGWASPSVVAVLSGKVSTAVDAGRLIARSIASSLGNDVDGSESLPVLSADYDCGW
jgi:hypothetical protein